MLLVRPMRCVRVTCRLVLCLLFFFLLLRPPPTSTLFPYTTLFRSAARRHDAVLFFDEADAIASLRTANIEGSGRRSEEHTSELQSRPHLVCRLLLEKKNQTPIAAQLP